MSQNSISFLLWYISYCQKFTVNLSCKRKDGQDMVAHGMNEVFKKGVTGDPKIIQEFPRTSLTQSIIENESSVAPGQAVSAPCSAIGKRQQALPLWEKTPNNNF